MLIVRLNCLEGFIKNIPIVVLKEQHFIKCNWYLKMAEISNLKVTKNTKHCKKYTMFYSFAIYILSPY